MIHKKFIRLFFGSGFVEAAAGVLKWLTINSTDVSSRKFLSDDLFNYFPNDLTDGLSDDFDIRNKIILVYPWFGLDYTCLGIW